MHCATSTGAAGAGGLPFTDDWLRHLAILVKTSRSFGGGALAGPPAGPATFEGTALWPPPGCMLRPVVSGT